MQPGAAPHTGISTLRRQRILNRFLADCQQHYFILKTERAVIDRAVTLTQSYRLRGYDAVQLSTVLENRILLTDEGNFTLTYVAADNDLLSAAQSELVITHKSALPLEEMRNFCAIHQRETGDMGNHRKLGIDNSNRS